MENIRKICLILFLLLTNLASFAQGEPDPGGDPPAAPINANLIILAFVGVLFILYTLKQDKKTI